MSAGKEAMPERPTAKHFPALNWRGAAAGALFFAHAETISYMHAAEAEIARLRKEVASLDSLQSKYAIQYATETADRLGWQARAQSAEAKVAEIESKLLAANALLEGEREGA